MSDITIALVGLFCTTVTSIVTFVLTKRKYNTEVEAQQIKNMSDSFTVQSKILKETIDLQNQKIEALQKENDDLKKQVHQLQIQMINLLSNFKAKEE